MAEAGGNNFEAVYIFIDRKNLFLLLLINHCNYNFVLGNCNIFVPKSPCIMIIQFTRLDYRKKHLIN